MTIPLLIILTAAAAVGGIVPQAPITPNAELLYRSYGTFWYNIIKILLLDDVFHSWWFIALLGLFSVNLVICAVRRLRRSIRILAAPLRPLAETSAKDAAVASFRDKRPDEVREAARRALKKRRFRFREAGEQLFGERWRFSRLGPDLVHVGILVILTGGLLGIFQFEGYISLNETELGKVFPPCSRPQQVNCIKN
ncbi:MAG: cytochrome c biogenesis protein ResB, partial [Candidatus Bipolaricaulia bacterium]